MGKQAEFAKFANRLVRIMADRPAPAGPTALAVAGMRARCMFSTWRRSNFAQTDTWIEVRNFRRVRHGAGPFQQGHSAMGDKKQKPAKPGAKTVKK